MKTDHVIDGEVWLSLGRAAGVIGMSTVAVRKLMGTGVVEWRPIRPGSRTLLLRKRDVVRIALEHHAAMRARQRQTAVRHPRPTKPIAHPITPTAPPLVIDPFSHRTPDQEPLPMDSGRGGSGWAGTRRTR